MRKGPVRKYLENLSVRRYFEGFSDGSDGRITIGGLIFGILLSPVMLIGYIMDYISNIELD